MANRHPKLVYSMICEDIRREVGNKISIMGVFISGQILVPVFPFTFRSLFFHLVFDVIKNGTEVEMQLLDPDGKTIININKSSIGIPTTKMKPKGCILEPGFINLKVEKEGTYTLLVTFGEDDKATQEMTFDIKKVES
jgi:hypothetical protein